MHLMGASDGRRRRLREPEEAHLAGVDQARHRADGVLDRDFRVDAMLVVEVDHVHAETLEALVARARHVLRSAVARSWVSLRGATCAGDGNTTYSDARLALRPSCELCDRDLPPDSTEAMICSFECTFCATCVRETLFDVCPNCGGGFSPRPVRP